MVIKGLHKLLYTICSKYDSKTLHGHSTIWSYPIQDQHSENSSWYAIVNKDNLKSPTPRRRVKDNR